MKRSQQKDNDRHSSISDAMFRAGLQAPKEPSVRTGCIRDVVESHDQRGWNYAWLTPYFGLLQWVDHREPAEHITKSKNKPAADWKTYGKWHWERHGAVIDHNPKHLVKEHMRYYVDPTTRQIDLRYYFQLPNGLVYVTFPVLEFYELEAQWFRRHGLCGEGTNRKEAIYLDSLMSASYKLPGLTPYIDARKIMRNMMPTPLIAVRSMEDALRSMHIAVSPRGRKSKSKPKSKVVVSIATMLG